ncbi:MAG: 16S rRNA (uracil(1498)-N(3))-methyltransferase [Dethiobacter sp.]|nr:16S rRNA (uracil(1498)-N(3))-methyltransferase [Dethiobacter sp.]MBS3901786.1 16S rRNA (uracil(1498)-N(3))-methyltransferase [Dethiobacter sp.]MBS3989585.1 16S rRNA (uracil(1498)-N(3))-methyltransferase [Dethiobacter sp.]
MNRFFYKKSQLLSEHTVELSGDDAHHLQRVLRASVGESLELCCETGRCRRAEILAVGKNSVSCRLGDFLPDSEPSVQFSVAFGLLKGEKAEFILQKATELGAAAFIPFISGRTVIRPDKEMENRSQRWQKIIRSAAAQSRRNLIPPLHSPVSWQQLLELAKSFDKALLFWEGKGGKPLSAVLKNLQPKSRILLVTGPEGGFGDEEAVAAKSYGLESVTLGPRILRAETAALVALAVSLYQAGEMGGS